jgi:hypothetical protein
MTGMTFRRPAGPGRLFLWSLLSALAGTPAVAMAAEGVFVATGSMTTPRLYHSATLLPDGTVLIAGGINEWTPLTSAEIYDPATRTFRPTAGNMTEARTAGVYDSHTATLLPNGKVLIAGGTRLTSVDPLAGINLATAELYDPATGLFTPTAGTMTVPRQGHTATLLRDGKVLISGGYWYTYGSFHSELYDPVTETFSPLDGEWSVSRWLASATLLADGRVLIGSGAWSGGITAEVFDPTTRTIGPPANLTCPAGMNAAALLPDGKVLYTGGYNNCQSVDGGAYRSAEIYDPATHTFTRTGDMVWGRTYHTATLLRNGLVLLAGGQQGVQPGELYDPATGTFAATSPMIGTHAFNLTATMLLDGSVLVAGGTSVFAYGGAIGIADAEIYLPTPPAFPPTASAGSGQTVHVGLPVTLDGSRSSDPAGLPLTYQWNFASRPAGSSAVLSNPTTVNPTFTSDVPGDYVVGLVVANSAGSSSAPATVSLSTTNTAPVVNAGPGQAISVMGTSVQLDGSQSYDPDGDPLTYAWSFTSVPQGSTAALAGADTARPTFVADRHGTYVAQLVVNDPWVPSTAAAVTVTFTNVAPIAEAGNSLSTPVGAIVFLDGAGSSDANGDALTYRWALTSVPANSLASISSPMARVTSFIPDLPGTYVAQLIVNDGFADSVPDTLQALAYSTPSAAIAALSNAQYVVTSLSPSVFKNKDMTRTIVNGLNSVITLIEKGDYRDALAQLNGNLLGKTDGCNLRGRPDPHDWVTSCAGQQQLYFALQESIWIIEGLRVTKR